MPGPYAAVAFGLHAAVKELLIGQKEAILFVVCLTASILGVGRESALGIKWNCFR